MSEDTNAVTPSTEPHADELEKNQLVRKSIAVEEAIQLVHRRPHGVLSSVLTKDGSPFGSVAPFALTADGAPLIYVAGIAQHTRNLRADPRVSLIVHDEPEPGHDVQTCARATVIGNARVLEAGPEYDEAWARYEARLPVARNYARQHDFVLVKIDPVRIRYIGGFGKIFWISPEEFAGAPDPVTKSAAGAIEHLEADHQDALADICRAFREVEPSGAIKITHLDRWGYDVRFGEPAKTLHFDFEAPIEAPAELRSVFVKLTKEARASQA